MSRRVLVTWERGDGGPILSAAGTLTIGGAGGIYPRNGYLDIQSDWPQKRRISILNRRVIDVVDLEATDDPQTVARQLARGDAP